ncbi:MAG TPA: hypothetical protein V6C78_25285 [Crinalium sp.]|jgi:hypothetical protein
MIDLTIHVIQSVGQQLHLSSISMKLRLKNSGRDVFICPQRDLIIVQVMSLLKGSVSTTKWHFLRRGVRGMEF